MYSAVHPVTGKSCLRTHQLYCYWALRMATYFKRNGNCHIRFKFSFFRLFILCIFCTYCNKFTNGCNCLFYLFPLFLPYMFRALISPSSGVSQAVSYIQPFGSCGVAHLRVPVDWFVVVIPVQWNHHHKPVHKHTQMSNINTTWTKWLYIKNSFRYPLWWAYESPKHVG